VWHITRQNLKKSAEIQQKSREKLVMGWDFRVDNIVYRCLPPGAKMSRKWQGPCRVTAKIVPGLLELEYGPKRFLVNANNLKPFRELAPEELAP
jgi:hypothetical protein